MTKVLILILLLLMIVATIQAINQLNTAQQVVNSNLKSSPQTTIDASPQPPSSPNTPPILLSCKSDEDCPNGFSCWLRPPAGPAFGIPGSLQQPGTCWDNDIISTTF